MHELSPWTPCLPKCLTVEIAFPEGAVAKSSHMSGLRLASCLYRHLLPEPREAQLLRQPPVCSRQCVKRVQTLGHGWGHVTSQNTWLPEQSTEPGAEPTAGCSAESSEGPFASEGYGGSCISWAVWRPHKPQAAQF